MRWPKHYSPKGKCTNTYFPKRALTFKKNEKPAKKPKVLSKICEKDYGLTLRE
jgi:hypothetical protein